MTQVKRALLTGITGQDGSYLSELLLEQGYEVHGIIRCTSTFNTDRLDHLYEEPDVEGARLLLHYGELNDSTTLRYTLEATPLRVQALPQTESTQLSLRSPCACTEVFTRWIVVNYREA